ncbi:hypothetical protein Tco_1353540 [Tanacetum coccineum]
MIKLNPKSNPNNKPENPKQKQRLRRSLSVSAVSRTTCEEEFLNKRDNPLYWGSPEEADNKKNNNTSEESKVVVVLQNVAQRGRSVSLEFMRSDENWAPGSLFPASIPQSEAEQESRTGITYGGTSGSIRASSSTRKLPVLGVKSFDRRSAHPSRHPSVGSSFDSQVSNWEDGISTSSLSEAEEKTIKAVYEQMKSLEGDNSRKDTTSSEIYETVRSEVRRAIADIQDDLQDAGGPFLPLVEPEAASLPLVGVGLSSSQPPHTPWKMVLGPITRGRQYWELLYFTLELKQQPTKNTSAALVSTEVTDASKLVKPGAVGLLYRNLKHV